MLDAAIQAAQQLFQPGPMLGWLIVLPFALLSGLMPGGGLPLSVVILSLVGVLDPWVALTVLVFQNAAGDATQPVPAIMLGIPGGRSAQATVLDGYPMARQGKAGLALGASYMASAMGGLIGAAALVAAIPTGSALVQSFGSAEFMILAFMGLIAVAVVSAGAFVKGMLTAMLGLAIAMIGFSPIDGSLRATFGIEYLEDGIPLVPIIVGLFAIPEAIELVVSNKTIARGSQIKLGESRKDVVQGMKIALRHWWLVTRCSLAGVFVGILPALGSGPGHWIAYAHARATEKGAKQTFGKGDVRGVMAAESANNSSDGGQLIPTLVFGIPGSGGMAIVLAMLTLYGIRPGSDMLGPNLDITFSLVYALVLGNLIVVPIMLYASPFIAKLAFVPPNYIAPIVIAVVTIASFMATYAYEDLLAALGFGVLGVFMKRYGWPRPPILIAVVLGEIVERSSYAAIRAYGWDMFSRTQFLILLAILVFLILTSLRFSQRSERINKKRFSRRLRPAKAGQELTEQPPATGSTPSQRPRQAAPSDDGAMVSSTTALATSTTAGTTSAQRRTLTLEVFGEIILLTGTAAFFIYMLVSSLSWVEGARLTPQVVSILGLCFVVARAISVTRILLRVSSESVETARADLMDIGFRVSDDPKGDAKRWVQITAAILILYIGIWLVGFYIAVPTWTFVYLRRYARSGFILAATLSLSILALLVWVYGYFINVPWPDPVLF